jgi:predicted CxxxxCH...CXXCH cytochrome family protein
MKWTGPALACALALLAACGDARPAAFAKPGGGCSHCHGGVANPAPPADTSGGSATTSVTVGAHQLHLRDTPVRSAVSCTECHLVPAAVDSPGHIDSPPAEVTFGPLARHGATATPTSPTWSRSPDARCSDVYCHGAAMRSPPAQGPAWTFAQEPDPGRPGVCSTCHGAPPPLPHPQVAACSGCHPETVRPDGTIDVDAGRHIDGTVQVTGLGCSSCHGSDQNPAPPVDTMGSSATTDVTVGAHQLHLRDTPVRSAVHCSECHLVPAAVDSPGHVDSGPPAEVTFGALASHTTTPSWNRGSATCSGVYCHGATMRSPPTQGPVWTFAQAPDPGRPDVCSTCHGWPPPPPHLQLTTCSGCHPETVVADGTNRTIDVAGGRHIDGILQVIIAGGCAGCHGYPPASGAHAVHFGLTGVAGSGRYGDLAILEDRYPSSTPTTAPAVYAFGCGHCHPLDPVKHLDGTVEVEVYDAAAPAGSLKARADPAAAYSGGADGTCSGVYCHSSGQEIPSWVKPYDGPAILSPAWTTGGPPGCAGCHDDPPRYPSGGAGAPDANTHLQLADDGWEYGHFPGLLGAWHTSYHGAWSAGADAGPVTCQTCHEQTVDPVATGPSAFYWLDTTGQYQLPGGDAGRLASAQWQATQCATCHAAGGTASAGAGRVLPLRHVNGTREVAFDPRTLLPVNAYPGAPTSGLTRPYWVRGLSGSPTSVPPGGLYEPDTSTFSVELSGASYDPATKTCSSVACHLLETQVRWGVTPVGWATCSPCHGY